MTALALTAHCPSLPGKFFSFVPFWMQSSLSRGALREASARSSDRVAAWISDNALPPLPTVVTTFEEIRDSGSAVFGPTKILLSQLSELIPGSPPAAELLRMRKSDMLEVFLAAISAGLPLPSAEGADSMSPSTPPDSPVAPPLALCATSGCGSFPPPGHFRCADCASNLARGSTRPQRRVAEGGLDDLDRRIAALRTDHLIPRAPRTRVHPRVAPTAPALGAFSDSSEASSDELPALLCSALLRYRRKANPFATTKQTVYAAVTEELAVARVSFPAAFPRTMDALNKLLSELHKEVVATRDLESARTVYIGTLAVFLQKHASWRANKGTLRKRTREPADFDNARVNPKAPRAPIPDTLLDGHHIGECRAFVNEYKTWEAQAETDVVPPASLDFMRKHIVPVSCDFGHPSRGVYNVFSTAHEKDHAIRRARSIYRDAVQDVAAARISRYESVSADNRDRLVENRARASRRQQGATLSAQQRQAAFDRESTSLARLALECRLVMCGSKAWKVFFTSLDAAADADLVARGLGLPDDSDDESEHRRGVAARAWKAAAAVALTPLRSSFQNKSRAVSDPVAASFERAAKHFERSLKSIVARVGGHTPAKRVRASKNRCFQCNKRGCTPSSAACSFKGKAAHPKSRNGRRKRGKKSKSAPAAQTGGIGLSSSGGSSS